jgi:uncharacterized protein YciI
MKAQSVKIDSLGFETFEMREGDTTYLMKKYFLVLLKADTARNQSPEEVREIQKGHMEHMNKLAEQGYIDIAGPMGDDTELRGILIMRVPTLERALALCKEDPAVKAHRLKAEVHPWWAATGSSLK